MTKIITPKKFVNLRGHTAERTIVVPGTSQSTCDLAPVRIIDVVTADTTSSFSSLSWKAKLAGVCFILGKLQSIITVAFLFSNNSSVIWSLFLYAGLITASIVFALADMLAQKKSETKKEKEFIRQKDYDELLEKYNKMLVKENK